MIIDICGLVIKCQSESQDFVSDFIRPFKYFKADKEYPYVTLYVEEKYLPMKLFHV